MDIHDAVDINENIAKKKESIQVIVRCRPMNEGEVNNGFTPIIDVISSRNCIEVTSCEERSKRSFCYDKVYDENCKQIDLYINSIKSHISFVLEGFNCTVFTYGQTGTGKTFTMEGTKEDGGIMTRCFEQIFNEVKNSTKAQYLLRCSYLEIYNEDIKDLLKVENKHLELYESPESGICIRGLSSFVCRNIDEILQFIDSGKKNRSVGKTLMNECSSRSHAIFILTIEIKSIGDDNNKIIKVGKLNLVDLAGSERQSKSGAVGSQLRESSKINLSLSALGKVMSTLAEGKASYIPYRDSKLTRLLQDSLGGNAKTIMIANIGPANCNYEETLCTLRYASRAKQIKNMPQVNEDPKDALIKLYLREIGRLRAELDAKRISNLYPCSCKQQNIGPTEIINDESDNHIVINQETTDGVIVTESSFTLDKTVSKDSITIDSNDSSPEGSIIQDEMLTSRDRHVSSTYNLCESNESKLPRSEMNEYNALQTKISILENNICGFKEAVELKDEEHKEIEVIMNSNINKVIEKQNSYTNLEKKVWKINSKILKCKTSLEMCEKEAERRKELFGKDRNILISECKNLVKALKLQFLIIENFIPEDEVKNFLQTDDCNKNCIKKPVNDIFIPRKRHVQVNENNSDKKKRILNNQKQNILSLNISVPERRTYDYIEPEVNPLIQRQLDMALTDETDLLVDAPFLNIRTSKHSSRINGLKKTEKNFIIYPEMRGLVPR